MSFHFAKPERRILSRRRCAEPCVIEYGKGQTTTGELRQLDSRGARLRLRRQDATLCGDIRILTPAGEEVFGATAWRIGEMVGVSRHSRSEARMRALRAG